MRRCMICGKVMKKTAGLIGPECAKKTGTKNIGTKRNKKAYQQFLCEHDLFEEEDLEQGEIQESSEDTES